MHYDALHAFLKALLDAFSLSVHVFINLLSATAVYAIIIRGVQGITPLMVASTEGNLEVVRALLRKGARPNAATIRGSTALIQACHFGKLDVVDELLRHGALVEQANYKNTTALMRASQEGHEVRNHMFFD